MGENISSFVEVVCPECGEKIKLSKKMEYGYCKTCTSKLKFADAENRNLSIELLKSLSGAEIDKILNDNKYFNVEKAEIASDNGSIRGSIYMGDYYLVKMEEKYTDAKKYFERATLNGILDGEYGSKFCDIGIEVKNFTDNSEKRIKKLISELRKTDKSKLKYISDDCLDYISRAMAALEDVIKEHEERNRKREYSSYSYSSSSYVADRRLSDSEMREYHNNKCLGLWNPSAIDNDPSLTASQKQQLKDYNRIWGD